MPLYCKDHSTLCLSTLYVYILFISVCTPIYHLSVSVDLYTIYQCLYTYIPSISACAPICYPFVSVYCIPPFCVCCSCPCFLCVNKTVTVFDSFLFPSRIGPCHTKYYKPDFCLITLVSSGGLPSRKLSNCLQQQLLLSFIISVPPYLLLTISQYSLLTHLHSFP